MRVAAGDGGVAHGLGHENGVLRLGNRGIHQDAVRAEFHGFRSVGGGANSRMNDKGSVGNAFAEDAQVGSVLNAEAGTDRRSQRHDGRSTGVDKLPSGDEIIVRVGQDYEVFLDEHAGSLDELLGIREKRLLVANHFELHPVGQPNLTSEPRSANGFISGVAAGSVGQNKDFFAIDEIEQRFLRAVSKIDAAHSYSDHVGPGSSMSASHFRKAAIFPSAHNEPGLKRAASDDK